MKERTKSVRGWDELIKFVNSINPYKKTLVLSGWVCQIFEDKPFIRTLVFSTRPIDILKENEEVPTEGPKSEQGSETEITEA